jgi:signal transduction histidine kinase
VLQNLLANAIKYSPAGSTVVVCVEDLGASARVSVADQGVGIAPDVLPLIFDRFFRTNDTVTRARGLGLGLYISKMLVEAQQGQIWIDSEPEKGTTVTFALPREGRAADLKPISDQSAENPPR